jgi:hypothetical protein
MFSFIPGISSDSYLYYALSEKRWCNHINMKHHESINETILSMKIVIFTLILIGLSSLAVQEKKAAKGSFQTVESNGNPIFTHIRTSDPSAHVWPGDDRLWLYTTSDPEGMKDFSEMRDWRVFSTQDLKTFIDYDVVLSIDDIGWSDKAAWAPDCAYKDGKYYFYYCADFQGEGAKTGVAVGSAPNGPFKNVSEKPLLLHGDPSIFQDDDSSYYLYAGPHVAKLNDDMVSIKEERLINDPPYPFEGVWVFKRNNIYYWIYSGGKDRNFSQLKYRTGFNPWGPFTEQGILMEGTTGNNHCSVLNYKGNWMLFYHKYQNGRRVCGEILTFNDDGTIVPVSRTNKGLSVLTF